MAEEDKISDDVKIPQIDGETDVIEKEGFENVEYNLKIEAHDKCKNFVITEVI